MSSKKSHPQVDRILTIFKILLTESSPISLQELKEKLALFGIKPTCRGQNLRNIQRDISYLRRIGFEIKNKRDFGYYLVAPLNKTFAEKIRIAENIEGKIATPPEALKHEIILNTVIHGDCLSIIPSIPDDLLDLVICSPPYNIGKTYDIYNDQKYHSEYVQWLERIFKEIYLKLKDGGRVCINIADGRNGRISTHADVEQFMTHNLGYLPFANIIWNKLSVSNRLSWGSYKSPKCPSLPVPYEYILVYAKKSLSLKEKGISDITKEEFLDWSLALWEFPNLAYQENNHPAPFPEELATRLIKLFSWVGAMVLDPFSGSGTTLVACKKLNRNYIGIEISKDYCNSSRIRLKEISG